MHVFIAGIYGVAIWLIAVGYLACTEPDWVMRALFLAPFVVSGSIAALIGLSLAIGGRS